MYVMLVVFNEKLTVICHFSPSFLKPLQSNCIILISWFQEEEEAVNDYIEQRNRQKYAPNVRLLVFYRVRNTLCATAKYSPSHTHTHINTHINYRFPSLAFRSLDTITWKEWKKIEIIQLSIEINRRTVMSQHINSNVFGKLYGPWRECMCHTIWQRRRSKNRRIIVSCVCSWNWRE